MAKEDSGDLLRATDPALRNAARFGGTDDHLAALSRGTRLFEYRIDAVLGHGGFGITYLAEDTLLREPVAVKEFFPAHAAIRASDQSARARSSRDAATFDAGVASFLDEARIIARVRHPNIVQVRRFFEAHGTGYIVLDFVQGRSLEATLEEAPLPERRVLSILNGVLDGLGALHDRAILHRDLKPRNVILRDDDTPVLIDFGAARDFGLRHSATVTQIVSPNYSPPEQYGIGDQQGPWSDIYSLGAILYRAVTGKVPTDSLRRLRDDPLPPAGVAAAGRYDEALLRLVDALLAIEPAGRPASVAHARSLLPAAAQAPAAPAPGGGARSASGRAKVVGLAVATVVIVAGAAAFLLPRARAPEADAPAIASAPPKALSERETAGLRPGATFKDCQDCPVMTVAPAGAFRMGSDDGRADERPVRIVTLAKPFAIGQREVTRREWVACVAAGGCEPLARNPRAADDRAPATGVSWNQARRYADWLSDATGQPYRLPSEAEWEYAARGGAVGSFWWGDEVGETHANCADCGGARGAVVATGSFPPNGFGLYDTAGNAAEWVEDCWTPDYRSAPSDARAVTTPDCGQRVLRGGGFNSDARYVRSAARFKYDAAVPYVTNGLRVVSDLAAAPAPAARP